MSTTVYIWDNKPGSGHASMQFGDKYISNTPLGGISVDIFVPFLRVESDDQVSLGEDKAVHGKPTDTIELGNLNTAEMLHTYNEMGGITHYNFWDLNCSTVVAKLLLAGYTHKLFGVPFFDDIILKIQSGTYFAGVEQTINRRLDDSHRRHIEHVLSIVENALMFASRTRKKPNVTKLLIGGFASDLVGRGMIWYPGQVLQLANYLKAH